MQQIVIGIVGGGQLGRMTAMAAAKLGLRTHIFTDHAESPASHVTDRCTVSAYTDRQALQDFARSVDVITFEFENLPVSSLQMLAGYTRVFPSPDILHTTQNRVREKTFVNEQGIDTAKWCEIRCLQDLRDAMETDIGLPAILKTAEFGYDGKGQVRIDSPAELEAAWETLATGQAVLEGMVPFIAELSVIVARDQQGHVSTYPVMQNEHRNHILYRTVAPAPIRLEWAEQAREMAVTLAEASGLVGLLAVEMFLCEDGTILVNELAPRPHNSGHWTLDACPTSQFEQLVRAVAGLPLGDTVPYFQAEMLNVLGEDMTILEDYLQQPATSVQVYGKTEARTGRKMAHIVRKYDRG